MLHTALCKPCLYSKSVLGVATTTHFRENEGNYGIPGDGWHPLPQGHSKANPYQLHRAWEEHLGWHRVENNVELQGVDMVQLHQAKRELWFACFSCHKTRLNWSNLTTTLVFRFVFLQPLLSLCFFGVLIWLMDSWWPWSQTGLWYVFWTPLRTLHRIIVFPPSWDAFD